MFSSQEEAKNEEKHFTYSQKVTSWIAGSLEPAEKLRGFIYLEGRHQEIDAENVVEPIWKCFGFLIIFPLQNL